MNKDGVAKAILALVPKTCPECGSPVVLSDTMEHLTCTNPKCGGRLVRSIEIFAKALEIPNVGPAVAKAMAETLKLNAPYEMYTLTSAQLETMPRMGKKSAEKLYMAIQNTKNIPLAVFITAMQITRVGASNAEILAKHFGTLENLMNADACEIAALDGFGEIMASAITDDLTARAEEILKAAETIGIANSKRMQEVNAETEAQTQDGSNASTDIKAVVTGKLESGTRSAFQKRFPNVEWQKAVTSETAYLVTNEASGSSKYKKAESLMAKGSPIRIVTEKEFIALLCE